MRTLIRPQPPLPAPPPPVVVVSRLRRGCFVSPFRYYLRCVAFAYYLPAYVFMLFSIDYLLAQVRKHTALTQAAVEIACQSCLSLSKLLAVVVVEFSCSSYL